MMAYKLLEEPAPPQEGFLAGTTRQVLQQPFNIATRGLGFSGDVLSLVNDYIAKPVSEKIMQLQGEKYEGAPYEKTLLGKVLPTTETIREALHEKTGGYFKPKNKLEQFQNNVIEDAALLMTPGGALKATKTGINFLKSLGANLAGEASKEVGAGESGSNLVKGGALLLSSFIDPKRTAKGVADLYSKSKSLLPAGAKVRVNTQGLDSIEQSILSGRPRSALASSEEFVMKEIDKAKSLVQNGEVQIEQLSAQKRSLNEELAKHIYETPDKLAKARAKNFANGVKGWYAEQLETYGRTNPQYLEAQKAADKAFGAVAQSQVVSNFASKFTKELNPFTLHLFGIGGGGSAASAALGLKGAVGTPAAFGVYKGAQYAYRISKSPELAKLYGKALQAAVKEDSKAFVKYAKALEGRLEKEDNKSKYRLLD